MKKFLLTFLLSIIGFIGFSSAVSFTPGGDGYYSPSIVSIPEGFIPSLNNVGSYDCPTEDCAIEFDLMEDGEHFFGYYYSTEFGWQFICNVGEGGEECYFDLPSGEYHVFEFDFSMFSSIDLSFDVSSGGGDNGGGTGGNNVVGGIINGGTSQLSPVVSAIYSVMLQFIPYVVYIGIGILLCTLGFYAIKWLVNWLTSKINNYFK